MKKNVDREQGDDSKNKTLLKTTMEAHKEAEKDMEKDPDLNTKPEPGDDLDEGELAKLEGEE